MTAVAPSRVVDPMRDLLARLSAEAVVLYAGDRVPADFRSVFDRAGVTWATARFDELLALGTSINDPGRICIDALCAHAPARFDAHRPDGIANEARCAISASRRVFADDESSELIVLADPCDHRAAAIAAVAHECGRGVLALGYVLPGSPMLMRWDPGAPPGHTLSAIAHAGVLRGESGTSPLDGGAPAVDVERVVVLDDRRGSARVGGRPIDVDVAGVVGRVGASVVGGREIVVVTWDDAGSLRASLDASLLDARGVRVMRASADPSTMFGRGDLVVSHGSTAGLLASAGGARVVVLGRAFYSGLRIAHECAHEDELAGCLGRAAACTSGQIRAQRGRARSVVAHLRGCDMSGVGLGEASELVRDAHAIARHRRAAAVDAARRAGVAPGVVVEVDSGHRCDGLERRHHPVPAAVRALIREPFDGLRGGFALQTLLDHFEFGTALDVGCGAGVHAELLADAGVRVTALDFGRSAYFAENRGRVSTVIGDINEIEFGEIEFGEIEFGEIEFGEAGSGAGWAGFDLVWASHVLEHQLDARRCVVRLVGACREGGMLAITVPPAKHRMAGGHVSLWNAGLVLYHLALAGLDVRECSVIRTGYDISVLARKRTAEDEVTLSYDCGDIDRLAGRLPGFLREGLSGDVCLYNWPGVERVGWC